MIEEFPKSNLNPEKKLEQKMTFSFSEREAEIVISNLSLQSEKDHSEEFIVRVEKEPITLQKGEVYAWYAKYDKETDGMLFIAEEVKQCKDLPEKERLYKVLEILRKYVKYPFKKDIENLKEKDSDLAKWTEENLLTSNSPIINLSYTFEKGYGICGNLSLAYLYLIEKAGLKGIILSSEKIKNINRGDNNEPLFKLCEVGKKAPRHVWCEIQLSNGEWVPVDPSTKLIGDEKGINDFKKANYIGSPLINPFNKEINKELDCPIMLKFMPGDKNGEAVCKVSKRRQWLLKDQVKKDFIPFKGDCKLKINILLEKELELKIKIVEITPRVLPVVSIEPNASPSEEKIKGTMIFKDFLIKNSSGETVGNFTLSISKPPKKEATASLGTINTKLAPGKGYGRAAYLEIIKDLKEQNIRLKSGWQLSRDSKKVWDWLISEGKARLTDPGVEDETKENVGYSTAQYEAL